MLSNKRKRILIENVNKNIVVFIKNKKNNIKETKIYLLLFAEFIIKKTEGIPYEHPFNQRDSAFFYRIQEAEKRILENLKDRKIGLDQQVLLLKMPLLSPLLQRPYMAWGN